MPTHTDEAIALVQAQTNDVQARQATRDYVGAIAHAHATEPDPSISDVPAEWPGLDITYFELDGRQYVSLPPISPSWEDVLQAASTNAPHLRMVLVLTRYDLIKLREGLGEGDHPGLRGHLTAAIVQLDACLALAG